MSDIVTIRDVAQGLYYDHQLHSLYLTLRQFNMRCKYTESVFIPFHINNRDYCHITGQYVPYSFRDEDIPILIKEDHSWNAIHTWDVQTI